MSEKSPLTKNPYDLLLQYKKEADILSTAYKLNEAHFRQISHILTYPVIILSATASVFVGLSNPVLEYPLLGITLATLLFSGFNSAINPKDREALSAKCSTEFAEISSNINLFILENNKTNDEIKAYSRKMLSILDVWRGISPTISNDFIKTATIENTIRVPRNSISSTQKKKVELNNVLVV